MRNNTDPVIGEMDAFSGYAPPPDAIRFPTNIVPSALPSRRPAGHDVRAFYTPRTHPQYYQFGDTGLNINDIQGIWDMYLDADVKTRREMRDPYAPYSDYYPAFFYDMIRKHNMMSPNKLEEPTVPLPSFSEKMAARDKRNQYWENANRR